MIVIPLAYHGFHPFGEASEAIRKADAEALAWRQARRARGTRKTRGRKRWVLAKAPWTLWETWENPLEMQDLHGFTGKIMVQMEDFMGKSWNSMLN